MGVRVLHYFQFTVNITTEDSTAALSHLPSLNFYLTSFGSSHFSSCAEQKFGLIPCTSLYSLQLRWNGSQNKIVNLLSLPSQRDSSLLSSSSPARSENVQLKLDALPRLSSVLGQKPSGIWETLKLRHLRGKFQDTGSRGRSPPPFLFTYLMPAVIPELFTSTGRVITSSSCMLVIDVSPVSEISTSQAHMNIWTCAFRVQKMHLAEDNGFEDNQTCEHNHCIRCYPAVHKGFWNVAWCSCVLTVFKKTSMNQCKPSKEVFMECNIYPSIHPSSNNTSWSSLRILSHSQVNWETKIYLASPKLTPESAHSCLDTSVQRLTRRKRMPTPPQLGSSQCVQFSSDARPYFKIHRHSSGIVSSEQNKSQYYQNYSNFFELLFQIARNGEQSRGSIASV